MLATFNELLNPVWSAANATRLLVLGLGFGQGGRRLMECFVEVTRRRKVLGLFRGVRLRFFWINKLLFMGEGEVLLELLLSVGVVAILPKLALDPRLEALAHLCLVPVW